MFLASDEGKFITGGRFTAMWTIYWTWLMVFASRATANRWWQVDLILARSLSKCARVAQNAAQGDLRPAYSAKDRSTAGTRWKVELNSPGGGERMNARGLQVLLVFLSYLRTSNNVCIPSTVVTMRVRKCLLLLRIQKLTHESMRIQLRVPTDLEEVATFEAVRDE